MAPNLCFWNACGPPSSGLQVFGRCEGLDQFGGEHLFTKSSVMAATVIMHN